MNKLRRCPGAGAIGWMAQGALCVAGCAATDAARQTDVASAVRARDPGSTSSASTTPRADAVSSAARSAPGATDAVAVVNGRTIPRSRFMDLLLRSHGTSILEQLVALEAVEDFAAGQGIALADGDVERERERTLRRVGNPLSDVTPDGVDFDPDKAERALQAAMAQRNVSPPEFDIVLRRNALLRKIVESRRSFTEDELRSEFARLYGPRVVVRHVQVATAGEAARCRERIAGGEDFAEVARRHSVNEASAAAGGLLEPFSRQDDRVPKAFRDAAFSLSPGEVSDPLRVGEWHHILRVETDLPAEPRDFSSRRGDVEKILRDRTADAAMFALYEKLFRAATINIGDAGLREEFLRRYPERAAPR